MTKARNIADLLDANGDVKSASLDNVPASDNASALTTGTLPNARLPDNISDGGTAGTKVSVGSTGQRGSTVGQVRYNSDTNRFEAKNSSGITEIFATPTVSSVDDVEVDSGAGGNQTFVIAGGNFSTGDVTTFIGNDGTIITASSTTVNSGTQITAVIPKSSFVNSKEPYDIKITNSTNQFGTLSNVINVDNPVTWTTSAGNLGTVNHDVTGTHFTLSASDPDGDTITFSEVGSNLSASGISLNTSTGVLSGDPTDQSVGGSTTYSFTVRATANGKTADRDFNIIVQNPPIYLQATGGAISYSGDYKIHTFKNDASGDTADTNKAFTWNVTSLGTNSTYGNKVWYLMVAGGGSGGSGGGGAGGLLTNGATSTYDKVVTVQNYALVVGGGGGFGDNSDGQGGDSTLFGLTAIGGGKADQNGGSLGNGGSGGGGKGDSNVTAGSGTSGQGNNGGNGYDPHPEAGGGGGGASGAGASGSGSGGGNGGNGLANSITGSSVTYAGGGGGRGFYSTNGGEGGTGGGGDAGGGYPSSYAYGSLRAENYLGAGGAGSWTSQGASSSQYADGSYGGSGIVIINYKYQ
jgi:hypothetical protein